MLLNGEGPQDAKIAIVNDYVSMDDFREHKPLGGKAGFLFEQLINNAGLLRRGCYVTTLVPVKSETLVTFGRSGPVELPSFRNWVEHLKEELAQLPELAVVLALGNTALYGLTGLTNIRKRRGSAYKLRVGDREVWVVPTIHPNDAYTEYLVRYLILHDVRKVMTLASDPDWSLPCYDIKIRPTFNEAMTYIGSCARHHQVGFDIEVINEELGCFALAKSKTDCMCIPLVSMGQDYYTLEQETFILKALGELLANPVVCKVGQNLAFDTCFMLRKYGIHTYNFADTMIAMGMSHPDFTKGLDIITSLFTDENYYKDEGKKYMSLGGDEEAFWYYNAKDALVCLTAIERLEKVLETFDCYDSYVKQTQLLQPLMYIQEHGIAVDVAGLKAASEETAQQIEELEKQLHETVGYTLNHASTKQLKEHFYIKLGLKPYINRATGTATVNEDALKRLARKGFKEASLIQEIRHLSKLRSTYFTMEFDADQRLRCSFNPVGTVSGRLSSSKTIFGTGGNLQNLPPVMKKHLLADPGYVLYNIDLVQAENRIVAYIAPDFNMIEAFELGQDIHSKTAGLIFGKPLADVSDEKGSSSIGSGQYSERFWGKKANHGLNYGLGYKKFAFLYEIPENDAKIIVDGYHRAYPGIREYHNWVSSEIKRSRTLTNCFGRKRKFMDRFSDALLQQAFSFIPQSTIADCINHRGLLYIFENQEQFRHVHLLNQVHDSIVFELPLSLPLEEHLQVLQALCNSLSAPITFKTKEFVIPAEVQVGFNMKETVKVPTLNLETLQKAIGEASGVGEKA